MGRTREFRRKMRLQRIQRRKQKIKDLRRFYDEQYEMSYCHGRKISSAVFGKSEGLLSKGYYGALRAPIKTKTKNASASYRHKGGYGKAVCYSRHDKRQIYSLEQDEKEYWEVLDNRTECSFP